MTNHDDLLREDDDELFTATTDDEIVTVGEVENTDDNFIDPASHEGDFSLIMINSFGLTSLEVSQKSIANAAIVSVLDGITDGRVSKTIQVNQMERRLWSYFYMLEGLDAFIVGFEAQDNAVRQNSVLYMGVLRELIEAHIEAYRNDYQQFCELNNYPNNFETLSKGEISAISDFELEINPSMPFKEFRQS